jgi:dihydrofolate reductase
VNDKRADAEAGNEGDLGYRGHVCITERGGEQLVWYVERLWELARDLPVEDVPIEEVLGYLEAPWGPVRPARAEFDWIVADPDIDFAALYAQFDTAVMGRKTFLAGLDNGGDGTLPGMEVVVFSRTLRPADYPAVSIVSGDSAEHVRSLKAAGGKDIWLYGGGDLFRTLLEAGLLDTVKPAVVPVLLGGGVPLLPPPARRTGLRLTAHRH